MAHAGVVFGFVPAEPDNLARLKACQHGVERRLQHGLLADALGDPCALVGGALVAPQQSGTDNAPVCVQKHRAVHLPAQADAPYRARRDARILQNLPNRFAGRVPPVFGVLFRPQGLGREQGVRFGGAGNHAPFGVYQHRLHARCADVDAQEHRVNLLNLSSPVLQRFAHRAARGS
ncbi:hypothetical protein HRbin14_02264 [bacterium HR14]|nr:hypothetical protein HRbin14_02264 [bacterium HR14]